MIDEQNLGSISLVSEVSFEAGQIVPIKIGSQKYAYKIIFCNRMDDGRFTVGGEIVPAERAQNVSGPFLSGGLLSGSTINDERIIHFLRGTTDYPFEVESSWLKKGNAIKRMKELNEQNGRDEWEVVTVRVQYHTMQIPFYDEVQE